MKDHLKNNEEFIEVEEFEPYDFGRYVDNYCILSQFVKEQWDWALEHYEDFFRDKIRVRGCLFVNELYDLLGFEKVLAGQICGWTKPEEFGLELKIKNGMEYIELKNVKNIWAELKQNA